MSSLRAFHIGSASRSTASLSALGASHATSPSTAEPLKRSSTLFSIPTSQDLAAPVKEEKFNDGTRPIVAYHLLATFILVYAIIVVGGLTRLTESGLSITEWNPGTKGMKWPANQQEWQVEWDKYRETPEWALLNKHMTLEDFKSIYMWEWGHRMLGRFIGVFFLVPAIAFSVSGLAGRRTRLKLLAIASGIGFQGALGWYMVKSGLAAPEKKLVAPIAAHPNSTAPGSNTGAQPRLDPNLQTAEWTPRVSHFRLAAHLGTAFLVGLGCLHTAAVILRPRFFSKLTYVAQSAKALSSSSVRRYASQTKAVTTFVFVTAMTGALVAGLDAGLVYNEWPTMGDGRLAPPLAELLDRRYTLSGGQSEQDDSGWRAVVGNFTSNPVSVQLMHRTLATTSLVLVLALGWRGLRLYRASRAAGYPLPKSVPRLALLSAGVVSMQASLGIFTLLYLVPLELASAHQAGSVALLSSLVALTAALRKAPNSLWSSAITRGPVKSEAQKRADQVAANALRKVLRETSAATPASRVRLS
ncbi:Cytochrome oxidase assembly factor COX15 [Ceraceosorus bombacis]|uniref:Cytochrome oxidase assembly factor COX15 n=1 Tax=Ceraceosorus bombacis TaxID=401625 RepID=A0A0P1BHZ1_9BASI|nr:Cytochrome oxidase assembly factor COX15 [Ceraceosorus bombacis]